MLKDDVVLYSQLTGEDGLNVPIGIIGAYLDGYEKGKASIQPEIIRCRDCRYGILEHDFPHQYFCKFKGNDWNNGDHFCGHAKKREEIT